MRPNSWWIYGNVPIWDWLFIVAGVASAYYVGITWYEIDFEFLGGRFQLPDQVMRQGNPATIDVVFGTILVVVLLEAVAEKKALEGKTPMEKGEGVSFY